MARHGKARPGTALTASSQTTMKSKLCEQSQDQRGRRTKVRQNWNAQLTQMRLPVGVFGVASFSMQGGEKREPQDSSGFLTIRRRLLACLPVRASKNRSIAHDRRVQQGALQANMHPSNVPETIAIRSACDVCSATAAC